MSNHAEEQHNHIMPLSLYINIGLILLGLTIVTVWVSYHDYGEFNLVVAMAIAATKASLVALFFMHLKYDNKLYSVIFLGAIFFLAIFIVITMFDTLRRDDIYEIKSEPIHKEAIIYDTPAAADSLNVMVDSTGQNSDTLVNDQASAH